ncbi:SDR family oxidoreductase [Winogradskyella sp. MIT101101]|uniref:SDR family oxidoreductase n=1 Tax=Winogradskyella sp. MIT101101 TaxID=3098297 RepID=UPI00399A17BE
MKPNRKTILITGNRKGIGRYLTEYYLEKEYNVIGCSRSKSDLKHQNYLHIQCDVTIESEVIKTVKEGKKRFGSIDILINNAGKASLNHSILTPTATIKNLFETNYLGSFLFSRECAKRMMKKKWGRIVNFSTIAVPLNLEGEMAYASSKSAIEKMSQILAKELSSYNITVNTIGPTPIYTDLIKVVPKDKVDEIIDMQTLKRFGKFTDVSNVIDFFIDDKSSFITGQKIYLGGL